MPTVISRRPLQGLYNVLRFNWHFYVVSLVGFVVLLVASIFLPSPISVLCLIAANFCFLVTATSLIITAYVYDFSNLYQLDWIKIPSNTDHVIHLSAGFDETSDTLSTKFPNHKIHLYDIYESLGQKEISIQRAQKAYPQPDGVINVPLDALPLEDESAHTAVAILALHEIREMDARIRFFSELRRVIHSSGRVYIVEHLRDLPNFLAYTIGFLHFLPRRIWLETFQRSGWKVAEEKKHTPFINIFVLEK